MTILVTGLGGMLGSALAARLTADGRAVLGTDRIAPSDHPKVPFVAADVNDRETLEAACRAHGVTRIIHCGAISGPMVANERPDLVFEVNVRGTHTMLALAEALGVEKMVFLSSIMALGAQDADRPVPEDTPLRATDPYGASKIAGEALCRSYARAKGLDVTSLRVAMVYGPRRTTACLIRDTIRAALRGEPHRLPYGRGWPRQYVHVDDTIGIILAALDTASPPLAAYNASGGIRPTLDEVSTVLAQVVPGARLLLEGDGHPLDYPVGPLDMSAAARDLGYAPRVGLAEGIAHYAAWLSEHEV